MSTAQDATTAWTGRNPVTGEAVGTAGRAIALAGAVTPLSGGELRGIGRVGKARIEPGKLGYLFGRASGRAHNVERAAQNLAQMRRLGATEAELAEHLGRVPTDASNVLRSFRTEHGIYEIRESLFAGRSGAFAKLESTWQVMPDGQRRPTTVIPYGGR